MPARYTEITEAEVMEHFHKWNVVPADSRTKELVLSFPIKDGVEVRVMTSIKLSSGSARKVGKDAIRVFALDTNRGKGYISTRRVYRVQNWRENVKMAVMDILGQAKSRLASQGRG